MGSMSTVSRFLALLAKKAKAEKEAERAFTASIPPETLKRSRALTRQDQAAIPTESSTTKAKQSGTLLDFEEEFQDRYKGIVEVKKPKTSNPPTITELLDNKYPIDETLPGAKSVPPRNTATHRKDVPKDLAHRQGVDPLDITDKQLAKERESIQEIEELLNQARDNPQFPSGSIGIEGEVASAAAMTSIAKQNADEALKAAFDITGSSRKAPKGTIYSARKSAKNLRFGENVDALISPFARLRARWNKATTYEEFDAIEKETTKLIDETLTNPLRVEGPNTTGFRTVGGGRQIVAPTAENVPIDQDIFKQINPQRRRVMKRQGLDSTKPTPLREVTPTPNKAGVGETRFSQEDVLSDALEELSKKPADQTMLESIRSMLSLKTKINYPGAAKAPGLPDMVHHPSGQTKPLPQKKGWITPKMWKRLRRQAEAKINTLNFDQIADLLIRREGRSMQEVSDEFERIKKDNPKMGWLNMMRLVYTNFTVSKILPEEVI